MATATTHVEPQITGNHKIHQQIILNWSSMPMSREPDQLVKHTSQRTETTDSAPIRLRNSGGIIVVTSSNQIQQHNDSISIPAGSNNLVLTTASGKYQQQSLADYVRIQPSDFGKRSRQHPTILSGSRVGAHVKNLPPNGVRRIAPRKLASIPLPMIYNPCRSGDNAGRPRPIQSGIIYNSGRPGGTGGPQLHRPVVLHKRPPAATFHQVYKTVENQPPANDSGFILLNRNDLNASTSTTSQSVRPMTPSSSAGASISRGQSLPAAVAEQVYQHYFIQLPTHTSEIDGNVPVPKTRAPNGFSSNGYQRVVDAQGTHSMNVERPPSMCTMSLPSNPLTVPISPYDQKLPIHSQLAQSNLAAVARSAAVQIFGNSSTDININSSHSNTNCTVASVLGAGTAIAEPKEKCLNVIPSSIVLPGVGSKETDSDSVCKGQISKNDPETNCIQSLSISKMDIPGPLNTDHHLIKGEYPIIPSIDDVGARVVVQTSIMPESQEDCSAQFTSLGLNSSTLGITTRDTYGIKTSVSSGVSASEFQPGQFRPADNVDVNAFITSSLKSRDTNRRKQVFGFETNRVSSCNILSANLPLVRNQQFRPYTSSIKNKRPFSCKDEVRKKHIYGDGLLRLVDSVRRSPKKKNICANLDYCHDGTCARTRGSWKDPSESETKKNQWLIPKHYDGTCARSKPLRSNKRYPVTKANVNKSETKQSQPKVTHGKSIQIKNSTTENSINDIMNSVLKNPDLDTHYISKMPEKPVSESPELFSIRPKTPPSVADVVDSVLNVNISPRKEKMEKLKIVLHELKMMERSLTDKVASRLKAKAGETVRKKAEPKHKIKRIKKPKKESKHKTCARVRPFNYDFTCARIQPYKLWTRREKNSFYFMMHPERDKYYLPQKKRRLEKPVSEGGKERHYLVTSEMSLSIQYRLFLKTPTTIYLSRSGIHGIGVFTNEELENGRLVLDYCGEVIRRALVDKREEEYRKQGLGSYMFVLDRDLAVDATKMGSIARFINHSCDPNCAAKVINYEETKKIVLFAARHIEKGEELSYNYKLPLEDEKVPCFCGAYNCRKTLN